MINDTCAFNGFFRGEPFCMDNVVIKYSKNNNRLRIGSNGALAYPERYDEFSDCSRSYFFIEVNQFEGGGLYRFQFNDETPYHYELNQCFQQDIFLINPSLRHFTNYFFMEVQEFDLENQQLVADLHADFNAPSFLIPNKMTARIDSPFEIVE